MAINKPTDLNRLWANSAAGGDLTEPANSKINSGWLDGEEPPNHTFNWWKNRVDKALGSLNEKGTLEYDGDTTYLQGSLAFHSDQLWRSTQNGNSGNTPSESSEFWQRVSMPDIHVSDTAPSQARSGNVWFNTEKGILFVYNGSAWAPAGDTVTVADTAPVNPDEGKLWFDTTPTVLRLKVWDGSVWRFTDPTTIVHIGTTPPAGTDNGLLWWNNAVGRMYVSYDDGDSVQWVETNPSVHSTFFAGCIMPSARETIPEGWLHCNGAEISRTTYADLFTAIGTMYGDGDGSTTFNLPDYRGTFLRGHDDGALVDPDADSRTDRGDGTSGDVVGSKQEDEIKSHDHQAGAGSYYWLGTGDQDEGVLAGDSGYPYDFSTSTTIFAQGGSETRPKNTAVKYLIKV